MYIESNLHLGTVPANYCRSAARFGSRYFNSHALQEHEDYLLLCTIESVDTTG
jgi:hypothetical protein